MLNFKMLFGLIDSGRVPPRQVREEFITHVDPFLQTAFQSVLPPGMYDELTGYSRSYYSRAAHIASIEAYNVPVRTAPPDVEWFTTVREGREYFASLPKVSAMSARSSARSFDRVRYHQSTSAGFGYFAPEAEYPTHKGPPDGTNHKRAKKIAAQIVHQCREHHNKGDFRDFLKEASLNSTPDVAFTRTQLAELPTTKVRNVFGEAFHYVILEGLFAQPLIEHFMKLDTFYFIGKDPLKGVPDLVNSIPPDCDDFITFDWSGFDASVQPYEIDVAFEYIETVLEMPDGLTRLVFEYVKQLFKERKLASPDGRLFMRILGIPSGSFFTHIIDSIVNWNRIRYLFKVHRITYESIHTHGDDSLIVLKRMVETLAPLNETALSLGWRLNLEKSEMVHSRSRIGFLGRQVIAGANYRNVMKCLRLMIYTEFPVTDPQISIARLKAIDQDSGYNVPYVGQVYNMLKTQYGDANLPLPHRFKRFNLADLSVSHNEGI